MVEWLEWREGVNKGANQRCGRKKGKLYVSVIVCLTLKVATLVQCLVFTRIVLLKALLLQVTTNNRHPPPPSKRREQFV